MPIQSTPTRSTSEAELNQWNQQLRASPLWQNWMRSRGKDRPGAGLNDREQDELERYLAQNGIRIPGGMHIDQGGNLNQKNRLLRNIGIGAAIGAGALTGVGLAGLGPLAGLGGAGAAAGGAGAGVGAAGTGGLLASSSLPAAALMGGPAAITGGLGAAATGAGLAGSVGGIGGILGTASRYGSMLSPILGGAASGRAAGRQAEEAAQLQRDRLALERWRQEQEMGMAAPRNALRTSILGSVAANTTPYSIGAITPGMGLRGERPTITGGFGGLDPKTQQLAQQIMAQQLAGGGRIAPPPQIAGAPQSGFLDKLLGVGSFGAGILGGLGRAGVFGRGGGNNGGNPYAFNPTEGGGILTPMPPATINTGIPPPPSSSFGSSATWPSRRVRPPIFGGGAPGIPTSRMY